MIRVKAIYRSWGIPCAGQQVYALRHRTEWLGKLAEEGVHRRAEFCYQQFDALAAFYGPAHNWLEASTRSVLKSMALPLVERIVAAIQPFFEN
jgi:hypothetical protein